MHGWSDTLEYTQSTATQTGGRAVRGGSRRWYLAQRCNSSRTEGGRVGSLARPPACLLLPPGRVERPAGMQPRASTHGNRCLRTTRSAYVRRWPLGGSADAPKHARRSLDACDAATYSRQQCQARAETTLAVCRISDTGGRHEKHVRSTHLMRVLTKTVGMYYCASSTRISTRAV